MNERCPGNSFIGNANLPNHKLIFDGESKSRGGAVANIVESVGDMVSGGLFEISEANLAALDCYEGFPKFYDKREKVDVMTGKDKDFNAITYYATGRKSGLPTKGYMDIILRGAEDCGLSKEYIDQLKKIKIVSI